MLSSKLSCNTARIFANAIGSSGCSAFFNIIDLFTRCIRFSASIQLKKDLHTKSSIDMYCCSFETHFELVGR